VGSAAEALEIVEQCPPDLMIVDISLHGTDGLELIKQIRGRHEKTRVLVNSMHEEELFAERALQAGARGFVHKSEPPEKIRQAIWRVLEGKIFLSERMTDRLLNRLSEGDSSIRGSSLQSLSDRELEVFRRLGKGQTTKQIATELHLSPKTIETYRDNIKNKLHLRNSAELIQRAVRMVLETEQQ
jgi:DNA-binding NarL/FixJ family response regulator